NAFPGVATAYSDSTPLLLLPLGHPLDRAQIFPLFSSARTYASVTKSVETITVGSQVVDVMRRAISLMRMGRPGPAMVEIPADILNEDVPETLIDAYRPVKVTSAGANVRDVETAARVLRDARRPVIHAGQGGLYAEASHDLLELADLLQAPVMTTMEAKSAFPEDHPLALGTGGPAVTGHTLQYLREADVVFGIGCSFTRHGMAASIPAGKTLIHATNDERDLNKSYAAHYPPLGDARPVPPRSYLGWGKSHALGTGLGLIIGAKLAAPDKLCVNFMGDAAFGMTGLDFETAVRCGIPILTVVLNNSAMAIEIPHLVVSHDKYGARDIGGGHAGPGRALGGRARPSRCHSLVHLAVRQDRRRAARDAGSAGVHGQRCRHDPDPHARRRPGRGDRRLARRACRGRLRDHRRSRRIGELRSHLVQMQPSHGLQPADAPRVIAMLMRPH